MRSISGILMAVCAKLAYDGSLFAARYFRIAEDKMENEIQEAKTEYEKES